MECEEIIKYTEVFIIAGGLKICDDDSCIQVPGIDSQGITFEKVRRVKNRSPKMMISRVASGLLN